MKDKPLHALDFHLHIACKAKEKGGVHFELNAQKRKNINEDNKNFLPETVEYYNQSKVAVRGCAGPDG